MEAPEIHLHLRVVAQDGNEIYFKIKNTTPLKKLIDAYCQRQGAIPSCVRFLYNGQRIQNEQTPAMLDMEDDDIIDVMVSQTGGTYEEIRCWVASEYMTTIQCHKCNEQTNQPMQHLPTDIECHHSDCYQFMEYMNEELAADLVLVAFCKKCFLERFDVLKEDPLSYYGLSRFTVTKKLPSWRNAKKAIKN